MGMTVDTKRFQFPRAWLVRSFNALELNLFPIAALLSVDDDFGER